MGDLGRYGRWMRTFPYATSIDRVEFSGPSEWRETRPVFLHRPAELRYDDHGYEHLVITGEAVPAVRFTPRAAGLHRYRALAGDAVVEEGGFRCGPSTYPGYVSVSDLDPRYFVQDEGQPFVPIGLCMAGPPRYLLPEGIGHFETGEASATLGAAEYERWFRLLSGNGGNFARIWLSHPYFAVETEVAGELDLAAFARLDAVVEHARTYGIRLKLCFEHFRTFEPGSAFSKVLRHPDDGRTPESIDAWLQEETWRRLWLKKVAAYTARYGNDPVVAVWELWNEMDCVQASWDLVVAWTRDMLQAVRELAGDQCVTNSLGSYDDEHKMEPFDAFKLDEMQLQQVHRYLDQGAPWEICRTDPVLLSVDAVRRMALPDRPVLLAETGAVNDRHTGPFRYYRMDNRGIIFHDTTFPAFFAGAAGTGQIWHWDQYVDQKNLWRFYRPFAELLEGLAIPFERFTPLDYSNDRAWCLVLQGRGHLLLWVRNKADSWHSVLRDGLEPPVLEDQVFDLRPAGVLEAPVELIWPWSAEDGETATGEATLADGRLALPPFRYGIMVKVGPPRQRAKEA